MDVWDNLLIRACKANKFNISILRRILARRCGMSTTFISNAFIAEKLINLATHLKKEHNTYWYLFESSTERAWWYGGDEKTEYWARVINVAAFVLGFTSIHELPPTYNPGRRWRNK